MTDVLFVTKEGEELTIELAVQRLMNRTSELEIAIKEINRENSFLIQRINYLENHV